MGPIAARELHHDGAMGLVLQAPRTRSRTGREYWLDPARDYLVLRILRKVGGRIITQTDISYEADEMAGWVPIAWTILAMGKDGKIKESNRAKVATWQINSGVGKADFHYDFPEDTMVTDRAASTRSVYIVRGDGTKRIVTRDEKLHIATYDELIRTESGRAIPMEYRKLAEHSSRIASFDQAGQKRAVAEIKAYFASMPSSRRNVQLAEHTAIRLAQSSNYTLAVAASREFSQALGGQEQLLHLAEQLEGDAMRSQLVGNQMDLEGTTVEGKPFDWQAYRGKVVLVDFWHMGCRPCIKQLPDLINLYQEYRAKGFEIVAVSADGDLASLSTFLKEREIPWINLYRDTEDRQVTIKRYGITGFPTYVVISSEGRVLSIPNSFDELEGLIQDALLNGK